MIKGIHTNIHTYYILIDGTRMKCGQDQSKLPFFTRYLKGGKLEGLKSGWWEGGGGVKEEKKVGEKEKQKKPCLDLFR